MQQGHYVEVLVIEKALPYYIKLSITNIEVVITFIFQKEGHVLGQDHDLINWILNQTVITYCVLSSGVSLRIAISESTDGSCIIWDISK